MNLDHYYLNFRMKNTVYLLAFSFTLLVSNSILAQDIVGVWKTIDDNNEGPKSYVELYRKDGKVFGKIIEIFNPEARDRSCTECKGDDKDKKLIGFDLIKNMERDDDEYSGGTVTDPENGKIYRAKIWLDEDDPNTLFIRGYIAFLYRTQRWIRLE